MKYSQAVANFAAALLSTIPQHGRVDCLADVAKKCSKNKVHANPIPVVAQLGAELNPDILRQLMAGSFCQSLALGMVDDQTPAVNVLKIAHSLATGSPIMGGDPLASDAAVPAAVIAMEAVAEGGVPTNDIADPIKKLAQYYQSIGYDCASHTGLLGGDPRRFASKISRKKQRSIIRGAAVTVLDCVNSALTTWSYGPVVQSDVPLNVSTAWVRWIATESSADMDSALALTRQWAKDKKMIVLDASNGAQYAASTASVTSVDPKQELDTAISKVKAARETTLKETEEKIMAEADVAKYSWAQAILEAPSSVARLMVGANPNFSTVSGALGSASSLISAADESGATTQTGALKQLFTRLAGKTDEQQTTKEL